MPLGLTRLGASPRLKPGRDRDSAARVNRRVAVARNCGSIPGTGVLDLEARNASVCSVDEARAVDADLHRWSDDRETLQCMTAEAAGLLSRIARRRTDPGPGVECQLMLDVASIS
jgi:hypothetical protein